MRYSQFAPIVVTGVGATTPLAGTAEASWAKLCAGESGITLIDQPWAADLPAQIAGLAAVDPAGELDRVKARRWDRAQQFAVVAANQAWADAGLDQPEPDPRLAVVFGSGIGGVSSLLAAYDTMNTRGAARVSPMAVPMLMPNGPAAAVGLEYGAQAGVHTPVSACATGSEAIAYAIDLIRLGRADRVICGGTEASVIPLTLAGFAAMRALSTRNDEPNAASRPYDKGRDGFVMGEGAGALILEREDLARARGARIYAYAAGAGITSDAFHIAAPDPQGLGASRAIQLALANADLTPADVIHINAHATSTPVGDVAEAIALRDALGDDLDHAVVSATKSATGHLLGAAGAVEAVFSVLALHHRVAPPTQNLDSLDDEITLDIATISPRSLPESGAALSTSFGFGGHNVAVAFTRE